MQQPGHDSVGRHHEVFNQIRSAIPLLLHNVDYLFVEDERMHLIGLQVESTVLETLALEFLRDVTLQFKLIL